MAASESTDSAGDAGKVLVGYDGGQAGRDAIAFAMRVCRSTGDTAVIANVYPADMPTALGSYPLYDRAWNAYGPDAAQLLLAQAARQVAPDVPTSYQSVASTSSAKGLADLVDATGAELVVLGSRRRGQERRTIPGKTGHRILQGSPCPVAIVPRGYRRGASANPVKVVTVAFTDTTDGRAALHWAAELAERSRAELRAVTVIARPSEELLRNVDLKAKQFAERARQHALQAAEAALGRLTQAVPRSAHVLTGPVVDTLATLGVEHPELATDLLVIGSRGYGPVRRTLLGGVSTQLVRRTRVPLVVVPRGPGG